MIFLLSMSISALGSPEELIKECVKNKSKGHLGVPTCALLEACANKQNIRNICDKNPGIHACCRPENNNSLENSNINNYRGGDYARTSNQPIILKGGGTNNSGNLQCHGGPYNKSLNTFISERNNETFKSISAKCNPAPKPNYSQCCVEVTRCNGRKENYKATQFMGNPDKVQNTLNNLPGNCRPL